MRFAVLGPLEVSRNGGPISLGGRKQRTLLAILLLHANEAVSRARLVEAIWGERPPPSADESLDAYVYRLRKLLGQDRLVRQPGSYLLCVGPGELDADQFEAQIAGASRAADAGDHPAAAAALTDALALWRGPAWDDLLDEPLAAGEARRLEELRLGALESRIEAELASGRGTELVPELERLLSEHPLRERLLYDLMLALYRAGRQADALHEFQMARERLLEELGLEPGPELHELQRRILQHDPSLVTPRDHVMPRGPGARRSLLGVAVLALATAVTAAFAFGSGATHERPASLAGADGILGINTAAGGGVATATPLAGAPGAVATGAGSLWVADPNSGTVFRIDASSGVVVDRVEIGGDPAAIVSGDGAIWVASSVGAMVTRLDPTTESVTQRVALPGQNPDAVAFGDGRLWVADSSGRAVFEIDPTTGSVRRTIAVDVRPSAVAVGAGALWVAGYDSASVEKLDPASGKLLKRIHVGTGPVAVAVGGDAVWVANSLDATVSRIDPRTLAVRATIPVASGPSALTIEAGSVWVANQFSDSLSAIDPLNNHVTRTLRVGGQPGSLASGMGRLWAGVAATGATHRGGTLVLLATGSFGSVDPAFHNAGEPPQFGGLAYDTLVTFEHVGGSDGLRLVPDLALSFPIATDRGTTYEFRIRPRIRYSNGRIVQAGDFRRAIERLFRVGSPGASYFAGIFGAAACARRPAECNLSRGIVTNNAADTVVFRLSTPDPEFPFKLTEEDYAAPIPPGTPDRERGSAAPPGTGPYRIVLANRSEVRFARNPFFREWSHAAQPAGNPNVILWRFIASQQAAVTAIEHGQADWIFGLIPSAQYRQLQLQDPGLLHSNPLFDVDFVHLNTHLAPFNDIRVRQALNYAINRVTIAQLYGGAAFATPTCQPLTPGLPGYRPYCPYTQHPQADGAWTAPDRARARQLVNASGTRGERVDIWGASDLGYVPPTVPAYIASVLHALGYRTRLHLAPFASITQSIRNHLQLSADGDWQADYPDPSSYIPQFFACNGGNSNGYYCNPRLDEEMQDASLLEATHPAQAITLWTTIDHQLTNNAAWVPTENLRDVELVSKRLRNYQYNPSWGFLADQAWLN